MKTKMMFFRLNEQEEKEIVQRAKRNGQTKSAWVRMLVLDALKTSRYICGVCGEVIWSAAEIEKCNKCGSKNIFRQ